MNPEKLIHVATVIMIVITFILASILTIFGLLGIATVVTQAVYHKPINITALEFAGMVFVTVLLIIRLFVDFDDNTD